MTQPGIEPWTPRPLANTLLIRPMAQLHSYIKKVKLATLVESDLKSPFSIATTLRCSGG